MKLIEQVVPGSDEKAAIPVTPGPRAEDPGWSAGHVTDRLVAAARLGLGVQPLQTALDIIKSQLSH